MRSLSAAIRFLTRLPLPGRPSDATELRGAIAWFPLVGLAVGAAIGASFAALSRWWPPEIAAVLAIAVGLMITGGFHEDAVSDAADGLGGGRDRERVLAIMRDPRLGAYGAMALWVLLALRWSTLLALSTAAPERVVMVMALAACWGRWTAAPLLRLLPALGDGLGKDIAGIGVGPSIAASATAIAVTAAAWWLGVERAPWAALAAVLATAAWWQYLQRRLGGQSGDLLGAGNQLVEAVVLLVLSAR